MIQRTKERIKQTGEVFTPLPLVDEILSKLPSEVWKDPSKTFLDNSCGDGNFLVRVLYHKLQHHPKKIAQCVASVYGVEYMPDNVKQCRARLMDVVIAHCEQHNNYDWLTKKNLKATRDIFKYHIVWHDALTYHYNFDGTVADDQFKDQSCDC